MKFPKKASVKISNASNQNATARAVAKLPKKTDTPIGFRMWAATHPLPVSQQKKSREY